MVINNPVAVVDHADDPLSILQFQVETELTNGPLMSSQAPVGSQESKDDDLMGDDTDNYYAQADKEVQIRKQKSDKHQ